MASPDARWLPLFPLELVLLPGARLPLHIFEPRYQAMTARCELETLPFAIVFVRESKLAPVACEAWIDQVLERYPDGRLDVLTRGGDRLRLRELREHVDGYLEGRVETMETPAEEPDPDVAEALLELFSEYRRMAESEAAAPSESHEEASDETVIDEHPAGYTFALAAQIRMGDEERQRILETLSESDREQILLTLLAGLLPELRSRAENQLRVRGNGKLGGAQ